MMRSKPDLREAAAISALLMVYSNGVAVYANRRGELTERLFVRLNPFLFLIMLLYAARRPGGLTALGLRREGLGRSLAGGLLLGGIMTVPPLFFFYKPILLDTPLEYGPVNSYNRRQLMQELFVRLPLSVAALEELAFRGLLYAVVRRQLPPAQAVAWNAVAFGGWHLAVTAVTAAQTNLNDAARLPRPLRPFVQPLAVVGGMLTTSVAGVGLALLRERTGNLAGPMLAHWIVDGAMVFVLWLRRKK